MIAMRVAQLGSVHVMAAIATLLVDFEIRKNVRCAE
jgi:hypothetical protein